MDKFPMVETVEMQRCVAHVMSWLNNKNRHPFIVVGPDGCGKSLLLNHCFDRLTSTQVATIHCSAQTSPTHIIQKLQQSCMTISGGGGSNGGGRLLKPRECEHLVLYLKDINLPKPDKWGTSQTIAFLQQLLTYEGFHDSDNDWIGLDGIQIVASMNAAATLGRHKLTTRFTSRVRILSMEYANEEELATIYTAYLTPVLRHHKPLERHSVWGLPARVQNLASSMVQLYGEVRKNFSSDDHGHYLFTPRDLTRWCMSLLRYDAANLSGDGRTADGLLTVWHYEACRLFRDRLVGARDKERFDGMLSSILSRDWSISELPPNRFYVTWGARQENKKAADGSLPVHGKILGCMSSDDFRSVIKKALNSYKRDVREVNIQVFYEVLEYMARVDRVLSSPNGSLLMAGRTGTGRRTAVSVVAHASGITVVSPKVSRSYGLKQFKLDLKTAMQSAGIDGEQVIFLLEDFQLVHLSFLELINSLLSAGEVPGLYTSEELEPLLAPIREEAIDAGHRGPLHNYFAKRIKSNLHVVLIMDSTNENFTFNCESNPALYKQCQVQWMESWSDSSMRQISRMLLKDELSNDDAGKRLCKNFVQIHNKRGRMENKDATPKRFVSFLHSFKKVYLNKRDELMKKQGHLQAGLSKLNEATELVAELKRKAGEQSTLLVQKQGEADTALKEITTAMQNASTQKSEMEDLKQKAAEERLNIDKRKKAIDIELSEVQPLIAAAKKAVGNINPKTLSEIRALRNPPEVIRDILEGVLRLMGIFDTTWVSMKSFLAKRGVQDEIINFDCRRISKEIRRSVDELMETKSRSFERKNAQRASAAALPLAEWVIANVKYAEVLEKIEPLEAEQAKLKRNLEKAEHRVGKLVRDLDRVDAKVLELRTRFEKRTTEAATLRLEVDKANETIEAAERLVGKLGNEHTRWNGQVKSLDVDLSSLPTCSQLAAACITYLPGASEDVRRSALEDWLEMSNLESFDLRRFLSTESEQLTWKAEGLPSDELSMENALIILQCSIRPFLIDPSSRATEWLKEHLKESRIEVVTQQEANFPTALELAVRFGKTLIIQEMDHIEPILYPLLRGDLVSLGPRYIVQLGEKTVDYNEDFRLFMTTRNPLPHISPDAASILCEVNFTTTRAGLKGQLLALTIQNEKPELEQRKMQLLREGEEFKIKLVDLEDSLLEQLAKAEGNILENKELIERLNETKASSMTITQSLDEFKQMEISLDQQRNAYLPLAESGSQIYFVICDLSKLNNMYRFSLTSFLRLFQNALSTKTEMDDGTEGRINALKSHVKWSVFEHVTRSLFKADRLMFALHYAHGIHSEEFQDKEWEYFLGNLVSDSIIDKEGSKSHSSRTNFPGWIETERHKSISGLKSMFPVLYQTLHLDDASQWMSFARSSQCEHDLPPNIASRISPFQQVLVVQALRPDRLQSCMALFASRILSIRDISPPAISLKRLHESGGTVCTEPILMVLSQGADPSQELEELAGNVVGDENYYQVAMGQGQADIAMQLVRECARNGQWLCLKNLHLVTSWLPILEKELNSMEPNDGFRLWLTSEVHPKFPTILLQSSIKLTYESPPGIKKNLLRTYDNWTPNYISNIPGSTTSSVPRSQALFTLAWLHAVVQERRNFIPQGWTKFYEFATGDLRAAADVIDRLMSDGNNEVKWESMHGLMENALYGGRVDNIFDMRVLTCYLRQYFDSNVFNSGSGLSRGGRKLVANITLPNSTNIRDYMSLIEQIPDDDQPSYFGLPANIERSSQRIISTNVINQLKTVTRSVQVGAKFNREIWQNELSPMLQMWKKLNQGSGNIIHAKLDLPTVTEKSSPVLQFVLLERYNAVQLVQQVHQTLSALSKVMRGSQLLNSEVHQLATSILQQQTPSKWYKMWEGPDDPMQYLHSLIAKTMALQVWVEKAENGRLLDTQELNLADLFHPNTFLNAVRQQTARQGKTSMDELKLVASWNGSISSANLNVKIEGLLLEGCSFDGKRLSENQRDSPTVVSIPSFHIAWIPKTASSPYSSTETISLPIYTSQTREKIVTCLELPSGGNLTTWVQCGAALLLE